MYKIDGKGTTLENIHLAAKAEFLEKGYKDASLRNIVKSVGMTTGAFYGYYKSKEELFNMTVLELKEYVNSLSNPEIKEVAEIFEDDEHERDPLELLAAPKLFDYMKYANGTVDIDFSL